MFTYEQLLKVLENHGGDKLFVCRHCLKIEVKYADNGYNDDGNGSWSYRDEMNREYNCETCGCSVCWNCSKHYKYRKACNVEKK